MYTILITFPPRQKITSYQLLSVSKAPSGASNIKGLSDFLSIVQYQIKTTVNQTIFSYHSSWIQPIGSCPGSKHSAATAWAAHIYTISSHCASAEVPKWSPNSLKQDFWFHCWSRRHSSPTYHSVLAREMNEFMYAGTSTSDGLKPVWFC